VQDHSGLRFNLALIEAAMFRRADRDDLIVQPRVLAKTELLPRTILVRRTILEETDDDPVEEHDDDTDEEREPTPREDANKRFWTAVLRDFAFDDPKPTVPDPAGTNAVWVGVEGSGWGDAGLWFDAWLDRGQHQIFVAFRRRKNLPKAERVFDEILRVLRADRQLQGGDQPEIDLTGWEDWSVDGRPYVGFRRPSEFLDGTEIGDFDEAVEWMREHFNSLVSELHPECRRRLRDRG